MQDNNMLILPNVPLVAEGSQRTYSQKYIVHAANTCIHSSTPLFTRGKRICGTFKLFSHRALLCVQVTVFLQCRIYA